MKTLTSYSTNSSEVRQAWADLLSAYNWHEFITATFSLPQRDPYRAKAMFTAWLRRRYFKHAKKIGEVREETLVKHDGYGRVVGRHSKFKGTFANAWRRGQLRPVWVLGLEHHKDGTNHIHAAVEHQVYAKDIRRDAAWQDWFEDMDLGRIRLEPPDSQMSVNQYMAKYVTKGGSVELSDSFARKVKPVRV